MYKFKLGEKQEEIDKLVDEGNLIEDEMDKKHEEIESLLKDEITNLNYERDALQKEQLIHLKQIIDLNKEISELSNIY